MSSLKDAINSLEINRAIGFDYTVGELFRELSNWAREEGCLFDPAVLEDDITELQVAADDLEDIFKDLDATDTDDAREIIKKLLEIAAQVEKEKESPTKRKPTRRPA